MRAQPSSIRRSFAGGLAVALAAVVLPAGAQTLVSPPPDNLSNAGLFFDLTAGTGLTVTRLEFPISTPQVGQVVQVWSRSGTHVGFEGAAAGWTLLGTASAAASPASVTISLPMAAGDRQGIHLTTGTLASRVSFASSAGGVGTLAANNAQLQTYEGASSPSTFGGVAGVPRRFVGTIAYTLATAAAVPVAVPTLSSGALTALLVGMALAGLLARRRFRN